MPCRWILRAGIVLTALALAAAAAAQRRDKSPEAELFASLMPPGSVLEVILERVDRLFIELNAEGDTLNADDIEVHELMLGGSLGAMIAAQTMAKDVDRDGFITEEEVRRVARYHNRVALQSGRRDGSELLAREVRQVLQFDKDGDGRVSWAEAFVAPKIAQSQDAGINRPIRRLEMALTFDADEDGEVTLPEFRAAAEQFFRSIDQDGDDALSEAEVGGHEGRQVEAARRVEDAQCAMPDASPEAEIVLVGLYEAEALSSVTIGSQDVVVETASLVIEAGNMPVYVVISSFSPIVWRVSGAVERVEHLVLGSVQSVERDGTKVPLVGATGLPADRVTFLGRNDCLHYFDETPSSRAAQAAGKVRDRAGREPAQVVANYAMSEVRVPSGEALELKWPPGHPNSAVEESYPHGSYTSRFHPGGVMDIDAEALVSSLPAEPYGVLPQEAGIKQLLQEGALTLNSSGEHLITRKMRYPAGLYGAHQVTFLLLRGVPEPDGDPGHSEVYSEETGRQLNPRR